MTSEYVCTLVASRFMGNFLYFFILRDLVYEILFNNYSLSAKIKILSIYYSFGNEPKEMWTSFLRQLQIWQQRGLRSGVESSVAIRGVLQPLAVSQQVVVVKGGGVTAR